MNPSLIKPTARVVEQHPRPTFKGLFSAYVAYPIAERFERRFIRAKLSELRQYYRTPFKDRIFIARQNLIQNILFAGQSVPYYRDIFSSRGFNPEKLQNDIRYINDIPYLTKEIIIEQGERLLSRPLAEIRHHVCRTGGSTGVPTVVYYDQEAADYAAAVTIYARDRIGKKKWHPEVHFACRFRDAKFSKWPTREDWKCFAMNRNNIFFDRIDDAGLAEIWLKLKRYEPYLVHEHPSTIYALACYIERRYGGDQAFGVFESSGELLQPYMREKIRNVLRCRVVDRYGLAELGVMAYELDGEMGGLQVLDSEGWPESREIEGGHELVFTGFRNRLMPLIRYSTGDLAYVSQGNNAFFLNGIVGRIHDVVPINGIDHPTHHIMDILDHRVGGIQQFQIDLRHPKPVLRIVSEPNFNQNSISAKIEGFWPGAFAVEYVGHDTMVRVGHRSKFRHVVKE